MMPYSVDKSLPTLSFDEQTSIEGLSCKRPDHYYKEMQPSSCAAKPIWKRLGRVSAGTEEHRPGAYLEIHQQAYKP
jgi:hypothetical protein